MFAALLLAALGWAGLVVLVNLSLPTVGPRWLFFFLWTLALTGTALPFVWMLHRRFAPDDPAPPSVLLRQGLWVGLYGAMIAWLQVNRSLTLSLAILLGLGLAGLEWLVRLVERTSWRPGR
jgi:hypothetical protein